MKTKEDILLEELARQAAKEATMSVADRYVQKYGSTDGEASEEEIDAVLRSMGLE